MSVIKEPDELLVINGISYITTSQATAMLDLSIAALVEHQKKLGVEELRLKGRRLFKLDDILRWSKYRGELQKLIDEYELKRSELLKKYNFDNNSSAIADIQSFKSQRDYYEK